MAKIIRTVAFPEAGDGVTLEFRNRDLIALQTQFGDEWMSDFVNRCDRMDMILLDACLRVGGKLHGNPHPLKIEDMDCLTMGDLRDKVMNAFTLSVHGKTFGEFIQWLVAQSQKLDPGSPLP